jgi:hypothetical protein
MQLYNLLLTTIGTLNAIKIRLKMESARAHLVAPLVTTANYVAGFAGNYFHA